MPASEPVAAPASPASLPELLRIMDVATALRREREAAAAQLDIEQVQGALRQRLRQTAQSMGDAVSDAEIDAAIRQYFDSLHRFEEPPMSWRLRLAHLWVRRRQIAIATTAAAAVAVLGWWMFLSPSGPFSAEQRERRRESAAAAAEVQRLAHEQAEAQARDLALQRAWDATAAVHGEVQGMVEDPAAIARAADLWQRAARAREAGQAAALQEIAKGLGELRDELAPSYEVRVVSRPGVRSGIERNWDEVGSEVQSGLYLVVEAIDRDGRALALPIRDAETGATRRVRMWAEQVPEAVWQRVAADKVADGVVDESLFARKRRGWLGLEVHMVGADGQTPLTRGRQITTID